jgi:hypothetical protein
VGKTCLVTELMAHFIDDDVRVLYGGCIPVGEGTLPYAPVVEALRALLADLGADRMRALIGPSWPELARLVRLRRPDCLSCCSACSGGSATKLRWS